MNNRIYESSQDALIERSAPAVLTDMNASGVDGNATMGTAGTTSSSLNIPAGTSNESGAHATLSTPTKTDSSNFEDKNLGRLTVGFTARKSYEKTELLEHEKRMGALRKELKFLEKTDWKYESIDELLGD